MLLRLEPEIERERLDGGMREQKVLKYDGLRKRTIGEGKTQRVIDIIVRVLGHHSLVCAKLILAGDCTVW
jgi:hypothetical protein